MNNIRQENKLNSIAILNTTTSQERERERKRNYETQNAQGNLVAQYNLKFKLLRVIPKGDMMTSWKK